jgi:hypothetical protein
MEKSDAVMETSNAVADQAAGSPATPDFSQTNNQVA